MARKKRRENKTIEISGQDPKTLAFIITFFSIIGFLIYIFSKRKDDYVKFYAKQSLIVFIAGLIASLIAGIFFFFPGMNILLRTLANIFFVVIWIFSWINALSGEKKETPLIGHFADSIKL